MPKRPSFQFYPGDWRSNQKLRGASLVDRGVWIEAMCLFHESDEYGILRVNLDVIARRIPCHMNQLRSLAHQDILKGAPKGQMTAELIHVDADRASHCVLPPQAGPCWFSSRMLIDEFIRRRRQENGKLGGNPLIINHDKSPPILVNHPVNQTVKREMKMKILGNGEGVEGERGPSPPEHPRAPNQQEMKALLLERKKTNGTLRRR